MAGFVVIANNSYDCSLESTKYKMILEKTSKTFRPGETIAGIFEVISVPKNPQELNGIFVQFMGRILVKDILKDKKERRRIVEVQKYIVGGNEFEEIGPFAPGKYKFNITVPENSPCTFSKGKIGEICYQLWFGVRTKIPFAASRLTFSSSSGSPELSYTDGYTYTFCGNFANEHDVFILPKIANRWFNHDSYFHPMLTQKQISAIMASGKFLISLSTNQKCYGPGDQIDFEVKVQNSGGKNVKKMEIQLEQIVKYNFFQGKIKEKEKIPLGPIVAGPAVPTDTIQIWAGSLKIPCDVQPSSEMDDYSILPSLKLYDFKYSLKITLELSAVLVPKISEGFPIRIGCPLKPSNPQTFRPHNINLTVNPNCINERRVSMTSLAPSLPDYDRAIRDLRSGLPSYSCLDLSTF